MLGTVQERVTDQLPQSTSPLAGNFWQAGWVEGPVGVRFDAITRAPLPP